MDEIELNPLGLVDKTALQFLQSKKLLPGFSHYDVWLHEHAVAFTVAKMMDADLLAETKTALQDALQNGTDFNTFKQRLKPYLMSQGWWGEQIMLDPLDGQAKIVQLGSTRRLETIFQTNMATSFAAGQWSRIQTNKAALPYLRYNPSAAGNPRDAHKPYYNLILPVDHELWSQIYPPNGYGCLCTVSQLTRRQAEREGITEEPEVTMTEFVNPRSGEVVNIPANITPSFAHNHGDRLGALEALFGEKHGVDALFQLENQLEEYLQNRVNFNALNTVKVERLVDDLINQSLVQRLLIDPLDGKEKLSEAIFAALWQEQVGDELVRFDLLKSINTTNQTLPTPDFMIVDKTLPKEDWLTLELMYTLDANNAYQVAELNKSLSKSSQAWEKQKKQILRHLDKADILALDMRQLNTINQVKIMNYVLELSDNLRSKLRLIFERQP
ncbi:phage minor head protein [Vitreoscilla stercoraria]|uniref:Phage head morphogenesis domain-containing protein n=1 Tax=Vitreoscilla stercoraria TaxID=61 RepID=A0ABY4EEE4_VITST|nr:phage minor head protein [Vitreoscilla stercoraria]UOO93589.1 hypothetical protein LVJ81_06075 [Vitreoscilla stercoraria]